MGLERSAERDEAGALGDGPPGAGTADNSAAVNQRVAASFDSATVPIADPSIPVGVMEHLPESQADRA
ncbi:MAG TPA: hypothetical protein PKW35_10850, partial [Nannocystaceae bacterium]|nr:hypothetical protein [Nannocystaceae bacterium]